jgi:hypothetical protein
VGCGANYGRRAAAKVYQNIIFPYSTFDEWKEFEKVLFKHALVKTGTSY